MRKTLCSIIGIFGFTLLVGTSLAQPGGGRGRSTPVPGGSPGGRATPAGPPAQPTMTFALPLPTGTRQASSIGTGTRTFATPASTPVPGEGRGRATRVPGGVLTTTATFVPPESLQNYLQYLNDTYDLPISGELPASSPEAESMLSNFASQYLGIAPQLVYAAQIDTSSLSYDNLDQILEAFPDDVKAILASMNGTAYAGVYQDGVASVFTGACTGDACTTTQGQMQFVLQEGALGGYGTYITGTIPDATAALTVIRQTFPALNSVSLTASTAASGTYSFVGQTTSQARPSATLTAYSVGTYSASNYTLVYALVGVGEGYAEMVKP